MRYLADDGLATAIFLAIRLGKPLLLEGAPVSARPKPPRPSPKLLSRDLVRPAVLRGHRRRARLYEWNYQRQLLAIRQAGEHEVDIYDDRFLIARPLLQVLQDPERRMLLVDEIDRSDHEFEALLLEFLSDFQITIPERGTICSPSQPLVVLTSNRTRELAEALRRRCVYHWIAYPDADREAAIIMLRAGDVAEATARAVAKARRRNPRRNRWPSRSASPRRSNGPNAATVLEKGGSPWPEAFRRALGVLIKDEEDMMLPQARARPHPRKGRWRDAPCLAPRAPFAGFARHIRRFGFPVAGEQAIAFMQGVTLLGPVRWRISARPRSRRSRPRTTASPSSTRIFRSFFYGETTVDGRRRGRRGHRGQGRRRRRASRASNSNFGRRKAANPPPRWSSSAAGRFGAMRETLHAFRRALPAALPQRRSFRPVRARSRGSLDLRRALRAIVRRRRRRARAAVPPPPDRSRAGCSS